MSKTTPQHKRMAMGERVGFKSGGLVQSKPLKTGIPDSPIEVAKRANGIPGMKTGGGVKKGCCD